MICFLFTTFPPTQTGPKARAQRSLNHAGLHGEIPILATSNPARNPLQPTHPRRREQAMTAFTTELETRSAPIGCPLGLKQCMKTTTDRSVVMTRPASDGPATTRKPCIAQRPSYPVEVAVLTGRSRTRLTAPPRPMDGPVYLGPAPGFRPTYADVCPPSSAHPFLELHPLQTKWRVLAHRLTLPRNGVGNARSQTHLKNVETTVAAEATGSVRARRAPDGALPFGPAAVELGRCIRRECVPKMKTPSGLPKGAPIHIQL